MLPSIWIKFILALAPISYCTMLDTVRSEEILKPANATRLLEVEIPETRENSGASLNKDSLVDRSPRNMLCGICEQG